MENGTKNRRNEIIPTLVYGLNEGRFGRRGGVIVGGKSREGVLSSLSVIWGLHGVHLEGNT